MTFLSAQPIEQRQAEQVQALTPSDPDGLNPGFFSGSGTAIGTGFGRVGAVASELVNDAGYLAGSTFVTKPIDALFDTDLTGFIDQKMRQEPAQLTASMTPDPYTTGSLGQILYGFVGIGVPAAVGTYFGGPAGGAAMAGGFQATGTYTDLTQQGVDPNTAGAAALFDGSLAGVGVGLPASIGSRVLLNTMLYGPGINVAQDLLAGQGMSAILENGGYSEMAERYSEIDGEMLAADAILGAAFGWHGARVGRAGMAARSAPTASEIDAGLAAMNRRHAEVDTAPGTPADLLAVQSHVRNLESATAAILDGRRVEVEPPRGEFLARPEQVIPAPDEFVRAIRESGLPGLMDDIDALEAEMTRRGRVLPDEELPDVRRVAAAADAAPAVSELAPVASRETIADGPAKIEPVPGGAEFIATTKGGEFRLVDAPAPAGADFSEFGEVRQVLAYDGDKPVGKLVYANDGTPPTIEVDSAYQRRGIATAMNKLARQQGGVLGDAKTGIRGRGAEYRTPAGQAFRQGADESVVTLKRADAAQEARPKGEAAGASMAERAAAEAVAENPGMTLPAGIFGEGFAAAAKQTESKNFQRWFGDSKVVDESGAPLVVYHGTKAGEFDSFDPSLSNDAGIWLTPVRGAAEMYAGEQSGSRVIDAYVSLKDPYEAQIGEDKSTAIDRAFSGGNDGVIVRERDGSISTLMVMDRRNIKSATANSGAFDPNSGSLTDAATAMQQADAAIARAENDSTGFEAAIACFMRNGA